VPGWHLKCTIRSSRRSPDRLDRLLGPREHGLGFVEEQPSHRRQPHRAGAVLEKRYPQLLFQIPNVQAQRRLRDVRPRRRARHILLLGHSDKRRARQTRRQRTFGSGARARTARSRVWAMLCQPGRS